MASTSSSYKSTFELYSRFDRARQSAFFRALLLAAALLLPCALVMAEDHGANHGDHHEEPAHSAQKKDVSGHSNAAEEHAPEQHKEEPAREQKKPEARDKADIVLLLDGSGSMLRPYENPLLKMRDEAAKSLLQFLNEGDRLAIVEFTESQRLVRPLSAFSPPQSEGISDIISQLEIKGIYSEISSAIKFASALLKQDPRQDANRIIILLSDGILDAPVQAGDVEALKSVLINEYLPQLKAEGIKVHALVLGDLYVDKDFLAQVALGTDGANWPASSSENIEKVYSDLFHVVKRPQYASVAKKSFRIDPNILEATFYFSREGGAEISITAPKGEEFKAGAKSAKVKWYSGNSFDVVTFSDPEVGEWSVNGLASTDTFAAVLTDLKLIADWPSSLHSGEAALLQARLFESKRPVVLPELSEVTEYSFLVTPTDRVSQPILKELLEDTGKGGDSEAHDGMFSAELIVDEPGEYKLLVIARGPTFERRQQLAFRVDPRLVSLRVEIGGEDHGGAHTSHGGHGAGANSSGDQFIVELSEEAVSLKKIKLALTAFDADNKKQFNVPLTQSHASPLRYEGSPGGLAEGRYEMHATITGEGRAKKMVKGESESVPYLRGKEGAEGQVIKVVDLDQSKKAEPEPPSPPKAWPWVILIALLNAGSGYYSVRKLQRAESSSEAAEDVFEPPKDLISALEVLGKKAALTQIDLDDPILTGSGPVSTLTQRKKSGDAEAAAPAAEEQASEDAAADEATPEATPAAAEDAAQDAGSESAEPSAEEQQEGSEGQ